MTETTKLDVGGSFTVEAADKKPIQALFIVSKYSRYFAIIVRDTGQILWSTLLTEFNTNADGASSGKDYSYYGVKTEPRFIDSQLKYSGNAFHRPSDVAYAMPKLPDAEDWILFYKVSAPMLPGMMKSFCGESRLPTIIQN